MSDFFPCNVGVRQGESLSPLLFAMYLNDFNDFISRQYSGLNFLSEKVRDSLRGEVETYLKLFCLLYADDTIEIPESGKELQKDLNAVHDYCN